MLCNKHFGCSRSIVLGTLTMIESTPASQACVTHIMALKNES